MAMDIRDALIELNPTNNDYLRISGNSHLLEFLNRSNRITEPESIFFSDSVFKVNRRGNWQERHLVITNRALYNFLPHKYKQCRRQIDLTQLVGILLSRTSDEMVFKVHNQHDYRFRIIRRAEAVNATCAQYRRATSRHLKAIIWNTTNLAEMTTSKKDCQKGIFRGESLFVDVLADDSKSDVDEDIGASAASATSASTAATSSDPAVAAAAAAAAAVLGEPNAASSAAPRSSVNLGSKRASVDISAAAAAAAAPRVLVEGWLAKKVTSHKGWRRRYFRLIPPNLQYYEPRVKGCVTITDGVLKRLPRATRDESLEAYLDDPDKLEALVDFCKAAMQEETICFYLDVKHFQSLPQDSAQQFNIGQAIFDRYVRSGADAEVFLWTELREDIQDAIMVAQEKKVLPSTIFDDALRLVMSQLRSDTFPRFLSKVKKRDSSLALESERSDECPNCAVKYSLTKRRHTCGRCRSVYCGSCVTADLSFRDANGAMVQERVCDMCEFLLTQNCDAMYAFSYVSRQRPRPLYLAADCKKDMVDWIHDLESVIGCSECQSRREGWLKKKNPNSALWRARFFVREGNRLWYYEMCYKGRITVSRGVGVHHSGATVPTLTTESSTFGGLQSHSDFSYRFIVSNSDRVYNMAADTEEDMHRWIDGLKKAASPEAASTPSLSVPDDITSVLNTSFFREAPKGEVTMVFTDIQSSTTLWEKVPDAMNEALERHDLILRENLQEFRGYEVKTEGDAFMVTFFTAQDAMRWCIAVQKALLYCQWPQELLTMEPASKELDYKGRIIFCGIRVRMGVHTGFPNCRRNPVTSRMDYFGPMVNRAARIADSAHGGQIICTDEVHNILLKSSAEPLVLTELGTFPYKGISELVRVWQVSSPELASRQFPPLRIHADLPRRTLPHPPPDPANAAAAAAAAAAADLFCFTDEHDDTAPYDEPSAEQHLQPSTSPSRSCSSCSSAATSDAPPALAAHRLLTPPSSPIPQPPISRSAADTLTHLPDVLWQGASSVSSASGDRR